MPLIIAPLVSSSMIVLDVESEQTLAALERVVTALEGLGDVTTVLRVSEGHALLHCIALQ